MNRTPKYLSGAVKRITGRSISDWIDEVVVIEIKRQLKTTDRTVLQISEELNFSSPSVFVQYFRHHTGMTPRQYRKEGLRRIPYLFWQGRFVLLCPASSPRLRPYLHKWRKSITFVDLCGP